MTHKKPRLFLRKEPGLFCLKKVQAFLADTTVFYGAGNAKKTGAQAERLCAGLLLFTWIQSRIGAAGYFN